MLLKVGDVIKVKYIGTDQKRVRCDCQEGNSSQSERQ